MAEELNDILATKTFSMQDLHTVNHLIKAGSLKDALATIQNAPEIPATKETAEKQMRLKEHADDAISTIENAIDFENKTIQKLTTKKNGEILVASGLGVAATGAGTLFALKAAAVVGFAGLNVATLGVAGAAALTVGAVGITSAMAYKYYKAQQGIDKSELCIEEIEKLDKEFKEILDNELKNRQANTVENTLNNRAENTLSSTIDPMDLIKQLAKSGLDDLPIELIEKIANDQLTPEEIEALLKVAEQNTEQDVAISVEPIPAPNKVGTASPTTVAVDFDEVDLNEVDLDLSDLEEPRHADIIPSSPSATKDRLDALDLSEHHSVEVIEYNGEDVGNVRDTLADTVKKSGHQQEGSDLEHSQQHQQEMERQESRLEEKQAAAVKVDQPDEETKSKSGRKLQ